MTTIERVVERLTEARALRTSHPSSTSVYRERWNYGRPTGARSNSNVPRQPTGPAKSERGRGAG
jgi:hypothetical protein